MLKSFISSIVSPGPSFPRSSGNGPLKKIGGHVGEKLGGSTGRKIGEAVGDAADKSTRPVVY